MQIMKWWLLQERKSYPWKIRAIPTIFWFPLTDYRCRTRGPFNTKDEALNKANELNSNRSTE